MKRIWALLLLGGAISVGAWSLGKTEAPPADESARYRAMSWDQITEEAKGQTVYWYMWGGSDAVNGFVQGYVSDRLQEEYGVALKMVPVTDAQVFVNKVLGERLAGKNRNGAVDLMWINGENFRTMREADLLFGPFAGKLPNITFVNTDAPSIAHDFGYPVNGYESPYGSAQMVMIYDSARVPDPPTTIEDLLAWIRAHPQRFTYPAIPDFTGSAFIRHLLYYVGGGYQRFLGPFDQDTFNEVAPELWKLLNGLKPYLWREGRTYPETHAQLQNLFSNGEVYFDMDYNPNIAANLIRQGRYPESTRTFVFNSGTIGNTHYVAIAYNSPHKAAAMVLANLLLDPATQLEKMKPEVWGDLTVLDVPNLPAPWPSRFAAIPRPPSVLPPDVLATHKIPELQAAWLDAIEKGWKEHVLQQ